MALLSGARGALRFVLAALALPLLGCGQTPVTVTLHSLQESGNLSFVCQADDGTGLKLDECPDYEEQHRRILSLVTQRSTNEVAVIDLRGGTVVDLDPSVPGYSFARVGGVPGAIVSTPGGVASFVGVSGFRSNGIFALPTKCMTTPLPGQPTPDLTSWAACALSSTPGDIQLLLDTSPQSSCGTTQAGASSTALQESRACSADLSQEDSPFGRRKLLVALPDEHKLVLLDAQELLDRNPGEFNACTVEATYALDAQLPTGPVTPELPPDLQISASAADANTCVPITYPPISGTQPSPAGMTLSGNTLYVADSTLPVVHRIDVTDPCAPAEQAPLLPHSYATPERVVKTSRVAVSPLTPLGKQYLYAVDSGDSPPSVMVFDVSPGVTNRTSIVFPGAPRQPFSQPDRIKFASAVKDVSFVMRDFPEPDPTTGVGQFGVTCDPNPALPLTAPGALYRSNSDFTSGASPVNLRGVFAFAMLENGQIPIIDVEDFDAPCRRPIFANPSATPDFRGCANDLNVPYFTQRALDNTISVGNPPTVTNESSCNIIEPNRPRAASLSISDTTVGLHAPTLSAFPQFSNPDPSAVLTAQSQPHLLPVSFDKDGQGNQPPAQVNVNGQLYADCATTGPDQPAPCNQGPLTLSTDPLAANTNWLTLPLVEPRSYVASENPTLTFEGRVLPLPDRMSGFLAQQNNGEWWLQDIDASFCSAGVEDSQAIRQEGTQIGISTGATLDAWATAHADYVQITGDFLVDDDAYWTKGAGATCANPMFSTSVGRDSCVAEFGGIDVLTSLQPTREMTITRAFSDHLVVAPRNNSTLEDIKCCFPAGTAYTVRASRQWYLTSATSLHDIGTGSDGTCVHTAACDPRKKFLRSRAFEVCDTSTTAPAGTVAADECAPTAANVGCMHNFASGPIAPGAGDGSQCIFENLTSRFVIYRGSAPSTRDMSFAWSTTGGFTPLAMSLVPTSTSVSLQSMAYLPELGYLAVVDGETLGLSLFDLNSLGVVAPSPFY